ncbi:MAG TPA: MinD/ParA family protein [Gammaproteobacteria bacterium]|nr:MinD/ParA family protein [Gammaproteobacteria bacterium]
MRNTTNSLQVIAVTSGKGGAGKTTVATNLAATLARQGKAVMLMDADLGLANIDVVLGLHCKLNLSHVLAGQCRLEEAVVEGPEGIRIVPASSGLQKMAQLSAAEHAGLINSFSELPFAIDTLIIDTAAGINNTVTHFCQAANEVIFVLCDDPSSLADGYGLIKVLNQQYGVNRFQMMANRIRQEDQGIALYKRLLKTADQFLNVNIEYIGAIPEDDYQQRASRMQRLVTSAYPQSNSARAFQQLAANVNRLAPQEELGGAISFFPEQTINRQMSHA